MRYLSLPEVLELHRRIVQETGGSAGVRDIGALQSALAQPRATFVTDDLYKTIEEKATALCYSLVMNHPFVDGNKRIGHAAMEAFLILNSYDLIAAVEDAERVMLKLAAGQLSRPELVDWIREHAHMRRRG